MVLGDAVSKLEMFVWILSHVSRSITWSLFILKALEYCWSMTNLSKIFHVVVLVYRMVKIWSLPQFPVEFRNGLLFISFNLDFLEDHEAIVALVIVHPDFSSISATSFFWCQASRLVEHSNCKFCWTWSIYKNMLSSKVLKLQNCV